MEIILGSFAISAFFGAIVHTERTCKAMNILKSEGYHVYKEKDYFVVVDVTETIAVLSRKQLIALSKTVKYIQEM